MDFVHYDLGQLSGGETVSVTLDAEANVLLLSQGDFDSYRNGHEYRYYGGRVNRSPFGIGVPHGGRWHLVIDLGGYPGQVSPQVRLLPGSAY